MDNQQLFNLKNEQLQVLLTGKVGDGCLFERKNSTQEATYSTCCIYLEYLEYKHKLLGDLVAKSNIRNVSYIGFDAPRKIFSLVTCPSKEITKLKHLDLESSISLLDDLGIALWIYDDGSLHKSKLFYNINTQKYPQDIQEDIFIPKLKKHGINAKVRMERKKDGRVFYYLSVSKYEGSYEIATILNTYYVNCFNYKIWSSETIQKWSKLQEKLKSTDKKYTNMQLAKLFDI